jgi:uncharacterized YigZ family protein
VEYKYKTITAKAAGQYKDKGSRFLAFGFPVQTEEEVKKILTNLRKEHHGARHHCYAYRLGTGPFRHRMNDDGEPSGTAGRPVYGQITANDLTDILVVVIRYFGGTLLGTSGLIKAYRSAASDMINHAAIAEKAIQIRLQLTFPFPMLSKVMKTVKDHNAVILRQVMDTECFLSISLDKSQENLFSRKIQMLDNVCMASHHPENAIKQMDQQIPDKIPARNKHCKTPYE